MKGDWGETGGGQVQTGPEMSTSHPESDIPQAPGNTSRGREGFSRETRCRDRYRGKERLEQELPQVKSLG